MMLSDENPKTIIVHPRWHLAFYIVVGLIISGFLYIVLNNLTNSVNDARADFSSATARADAGLAGVSALQEQVENLGGTPVVTTSDLPEPTAGEKGDTGDTGATGPAGLSLPGPSGPAGPAGSNGLNGTDGGSIVGPSGAPGSPGANGETVVGPKGEKGDTGDKGEKGDQGDKGEKGDTGGPGEAGRPGDPGPACPTGYVTAVRTLMTPQQPLGENIIVCVLQADPPAPAPENNPVDNARTTSTRKQ